jgi:hypothetical protein
MNSQLNEEYYNRFHIDQKKKRISNEGILLIQARFDLRMVR